jgi:hypothetical protein
MMGKVPVEALAAGPNEKGGSRRSRPSPTTRRMPHIIFVASRTTEKST